MCVCGKCGVCGVVWWMEVGWVGSPPHIIAHTTRVAHAQVEHLSSFCCLSLPVSCVDPDVVLFADMGSVSTKHAFLYVFYMESSLLLGIVFKM